jgi:hypothetical protein
MSPLAPRTMFVATAAFCVLLGSASLGNAQTSCMSPKDVFVNPFDKDSAHHRPLGTGAQYADANHPATRAWLRASHFGIAVGGPWGVDAAAVTQSDPVMRVQAIPGGYGLPQNVRLPAGGLITRMAQNSRGSTDGVAVLYDRTNAQSHQLRNYDWNNGSPRALQYRNWDIRGLGHGTASGQRVGTSASGVAALFGLLRGFEINTTGHRIEHALQIALPRLSQNGSCNVMLSRNMQLPATSRDGTADRGDNNTGPIPYGVNLALPPNVNINALGLSEAGRRLAQAIRDYGIYVVDGGGCGSGTLRADQDVDPQIRNQLVNQDIPKIYPHIRMVLNSEWRPGQAAVGGGQPIAPNCAYNAGATAVAAPSTGQSSGSQTSTPSSGGSTAAPAPSQQQSNDSNAAPAPGQQEVSGSNAAPRPGTQAARDWQQAIRFWNWAQAAVPNMKRFAPGTPQHERAKTNYDRNINNYIRLAARAGIQVTAEISPEDAIG